MKISAKLATGFAVLFAIACLSVAVIGFTSLGEITDPVQRDAARGYAWFWAFLGFVGITLGAVSWWMVRTTKENE